MLSKENVFTIYRWFADGAPVRRIARHFDITEQYVHMLVNGKARIDVYEDYHGKRGEECG